MPNNRRMGGPQRGGNRGFAQPFQGGSGLSPWQGAANLNQGGGLLSQLGSSPQQLALALTSLLSQQQPVSNPPSLLSLNTSPAFSNQPNVFGVNRGREMRRHEPYNKNRGGWRQDNRGNNNNRNINKNQQGNRNNNQQNRNRGPPNKGKEFVKNDQNKGKPAAGAPSSAKLPEKKRDDDTIDLSMDEEDRETKRDWKDEKNQSGEGRDGGGDENKEGRFHGVPVKFLNCFVCNKEMWDGESMEKHLKGRAHKEMFKALEESIHITVNILRENMRVHEERKMIEMNRLHRLKKNYHKFNEFESHCNMCDLKFMGKITNHRKTEGHLRLKYYLHPKCATCTKEFPSRLDWIEHRLTPEHLRKLAVDMKDQLGGADGADIIQGDEDDMDIEPLLEEPLQLESEKPILELDDQLDGLQNFMPAYKSDRAVATKSLKPFSGFLCELCQRSFPDELVAKEHLKTKRHYTEFVGKVKEIYLKREKDKRQQNEKEKEEKVETENNETEETEEAVPEAEDAEMYDPEAAANEDDDVNEEAEEENENEEEEEEGDTTIKAAEVNGEPELKMEEEQQEPEPELEDAKEEVQEEVKEEPEPEPEEEPEEPKPVPKPSPVRRGVKNGAGPKSKKMAVAAATAEPKAAAGYRIPKVTKAGPASKKK